MDIIYLPVTHFLKRIEIVQQSFLISFIYPFKNNINIFIITNFFHPVRWSFWLPMF